MDNHGLHPMTVQEAEQEMSRAAERVERFRSAWGDSYDLQQVMYKVYSMLPTCKTCGAYVPNRVEELERHQERERRIDALLAWAAMNKIAISDGENWVYADGRRVRHG